MTEALWPLPDREPGDRPELLLVGSPHLANQHRDVTNQCVPDVLTPPRQREMEELVDNLAHWEPTQLAIEWPAADQSSLDRRLQAHRAGQLTATASECDQIALRLADRLGLDHIHAVNCFDERPGTDADYDFLRWAREHDLGERLDAPDQGRRHNAGHQLGLSLVRPQPANFQQPAQDF